MRCRKDAEAMNPDLPSPDRPLRVAVAGAGAIGRRHIALVQARSDAELVAVIDPSPAAAALATRLDVPGLASLEEALASSLRPDAVILATPNALHVPQTLACLAANVAVLVEKPLAHSLAEGERLCQAVAAQPGARVLVGHHRAHSPLMARARALIAQGRLGRLVAVSGSALFCKPDSYFEDAPWRRQAGGGPILINLIHEIGNLRALCGEIVGVQASSAQAVRGFEVEDTAALVLRFANGVLGSFLLSDTAASARSWEQTSQENPDYASYADEDCYLVAGTLGSLAVPTLRLKTYARAEDRSWFKPFDCSQDRVSREDPLALQMAHFFDVARGRVQPLVSVQDGLQNLRVVEAVREAARSGSTVPVALPATQPQEPAAC